MPNAKLIIQMMNSYVLEFTFIATSHFLDGGLKLIMNFCKCIRPRCGFWIINDNQIRD
jgi:hypothetical protein